MRPSGVSGGAEPHSGQCSGTAGAHGTSNASSPASAYTIALLQGARRLVWWDDSHCNAIPFPDKAKKHRLLCAHISQPSTTTTSLDQPDCARFGLIARLSKGSVLQGSARANDKPVGSAALRGFDPRPMERPVPRLGAGLLFAVGA